MSYALVNGKPDYEAWDESDKAAEREAIRRAENRVPGPMCERCGRTLDTSAEYYHCECGHCDFEKFYLCDECVIVTLKLPAFVRPAHLENVMW